MYPAGRSYVPRFDKLSFVQASASLVNGLLRMPLAGLASALVRQDYTQQFIDALQVCPFSSRTGFNSPESAAHFWRTHVCCNSITALFLAWLQACFFFGLAPGPAWHLAATREGIFTLLLSWGTVGDRVWVPHDTNCALRDRQWPWQFPHDTPTTSSASEFCFDA